MPGHNVKIPSKKVGVRVMDYGPDCYRHYADLIQYLDAFDSGIIRFEENLRDLHALHGKPGN